MAQPQGRDAEALAQAAEDAADHALLAAATDLRVHGARLQVRPDEERRRQRRVPGRLQDELAESLATYADALERLARYAAEEEQHARDRRRASRLN